MAASNFKLEPDLKFNEALKNLSSNIRIHESTWKWAKDIMNEILKILKEESKYTVEQFLFFEEDSTVVFEKELPCLLIIKDQDLQIRNDSYASMLEEFKLILRLPCLSLGLDIDIENYYIQLTTKESLKIILIPIRRAESLGNFIPDYCRYWHDIGVKVFNSLPADFVLNCNGSYFESFMSFYSTKSEFIFEILRLTKFWLSCLLLAEEEYSEEDFCEISSIIELVVIFVGLREEELQEKCIGKSFTKILEYFANFESICVRFVDWELISLELKYQRPLILDPVNVTNNEAERLNAEDISKMKRFAVETLDRIAVSSDFKDIFELKPLKLGKNLFEYFLSIEISNEYVQSNTKIRDPILLDDIVLNRRLGLLSFLLQAHCSVCIAGNPEISAEYLLNTCEDFINAKITGLKLSEVSAAIDNAIHEVSEVTIEFSLSYKDDLCTFKLSLNSEK